MYSPNTGSVYPNSVYPFGAGDDFTSFAQIVCTQIVCTFWGWIRLRLRCPNSILVDVLFIIEKSKKVKKVKEVSGLSDLGIEKSTFFNSKVCILARLRRAGEVFDGTPLTPLQTANGPSSLAHAENLRKINGFYIAQGLTGTGAFQNNQKHQNDTLLLISSIGKSKKVKK